MKIINYEIESGGDTNVYSGLEIAFNEIKARKHKDIFLSIFFLKDGKDTTGLKTEELLSRVK
jgi:hypothetical protein